MGSFCGKSKWEVDILLAHEQVQLLCEAKFLWLANCNGWSRLSFESSSDHDLGVLLSYVVLIASFQLSCVYRGQEDLVIEICAPLVAWNCHRLDHQTAYTWDVCRWLVGVGLIALILCTYSKFLLVPRKKTNTDHHITRQMETWNKLIVTARPWAPPIFVTDVNFWPSTNPTDTLISSPLEVLIRNQVTAGPNSLYLFIQGLDYVALLLQCKDLNRILAIINPTDTAS